MTGNQAVNVKIPLPLLKQTIYLLEHLNLSGYDMAIQHTYNDVYTTFLQKQHSLNLRAAYAAIIHATTDDARFKARMRYLQLKREGACFKGWF
jgi:hypothetical protein